MTEATQQTVVIAPQDRTLAVLTHISGLAGYIIPLGGILVPIVIWLIKKDHRIIAAIAKQAILLNVAIFVCALAFGALALTIILLPLSILAWVVLGIVAIVVPIVGAVKASDGQFYSYPVIGTQP